MTIFSCTNNHFTPTVELLVVSMLLMVIVALYIGVYGLWRLTRQ